MKLSVIQDCRILGNRKWDRFTHIFKVKETITINRTNTEGHPLSGESWEDNMENKRGQSSPAMVGKKKSSPEKERVLSELRSYLMKQSTGFQGI